MAFVTAGFILSVALIDNGRNKSVLRYFLRSADFVTATADAATVLAALTNVTDAEIVNYQISERFYEDNIVLPGIGVHVEDKASVTVQLAGVGDKKANFKIPAPKITIFQGTQDEAANIVDTGNALLTAYGDLFKAGAEATISDGEDLALLISGRRIHAKSYKG